MSLKSLITEAEQKLAPISRAQLLLSVAIAVLPVLGGLPCTLKCLEHAIGLATQWKPNDILSAETLYLFANGRETDSLAFQEAVATSARELAAIMTVTMAYYYTVWCAYMAEGQPNTPEDVEAVPVEAFQGVFKYAAESGAVSESELCDVLEGCLAERRS